MNDKLTRPLLLEQLEERIFLDANPLAAAADSMAGHAEPVETATVEHSDATASAEQHTDAATATQAAEDKVDNKAETDSQTSSTTSATATATAAPAQSTTEATEQGDAHPAEQEQTTSPTAGQTSEATTTADAPDHPADTTTSAADSADHTPATTTPEAVATASTAADADHQATDTGVHPAETSAVESPATPETTHQDTASTDEHASTDTAATQETTADSPAATEATHQDSATTDAQHTSTDTTSDTAAAHLASATDPAESTDLTSTSSEAIDPMIGENFTFTVTFDNQSPNTVYGPYIDLVLDRGLEGTEPRDGSWDDGISFVGAKYLGQDVQSSSQLVDSSGTVTHLWATDAAGVPLKITGLNPGDQFVTLLMPFGSFTPDQTPADVVVTAHMSDKADMGTALNVDVVNGAMFGNDALNNPVADPPIRDVAPKNIKFLPEVIAFNTDIRVPNIKSDCQEQHGTPDDTRNTEVNHQEIPTGPNFPGEYISTIDIAAGQTVGGPTGGFTYTQHIPDNISYTGIISVKDSGGNALAYTVSQQPTGSSGGNLVLKLTNPTTGTAASNDVVITYGFYVPETAGSGSAVINASTGNDAHVINNGEVSYTWTPIDKAHDTTVTATINAEVDEDGNFSDNANVDDVSHAQSIAIQKDHTFATDTGTAEAGTIGAYNPGDVLNYTLDFQISDYFSFGDANPADSDYSFRIDDTMANGLLLSSGPTIEIWEGGVSLGSVSLTAGGVGSQMWTSAGTNGDVIVHYNLQAILAGLPGDDILDGGYTSATGTDHGATVGKITYQATIQREYADGYVYPIDPITGDPLTENNLDQGDTLSGGATITGDIFQRDASGTGGNFTGSIEEDGSCDSLTIVTGDVMKEIYAINGVLWNASSGTPHIKPGDTVSYRLTYEMPISSTENFHLNDYLPLPVFNAADPDLNGILYQENSDGTIANTGGWYQTTVTDSSNLDAGDWFFTSDHTYEGTFDTASVDVGNNALDLHWLSYHDTNESPGKIDLIFTVKVSDAPFTDGLFLTNQVTATENGTMLSDSSTNAIAQIVLDQPILNITKDATPVSGVDAGDTVSFTIEVLNTGHSSAYDIKINDTLPAGYNTVTPNFTVQRGGTTLVLGTDYNWIPGGGVDGDSDTEGDNFFANPGVDGIFGTVDDGYKGGIELIDHDLNNDGKPDGVLAAGEKLTITYDLVAAASIQPSQQLVNTATITNYAGAEGGQDHTTTDLTDTATVTATALDVTKAIEKTGEDSTDGYNVVIGETVTYTVTIIVPEGTSHNVILTDGLWDDLAFVSIDSITVSADADNTTTGGLDNIHSSAGTWADILAAANASLSAPGRSLSIDFGTITNEETDNDQPETITITYTTVVLNTTGNQQGAALNNDAYLSWTENEITHQDSANAPEVVVQEPQLQVIKDVSNDGGSTWVDDGRFDQNDTISYRITVQHGATSTEDAFDVLFTDTLPTGIDWTNATVSVASGDDPIGTLDSVNDGVFTASWESILSGHSTTFIITGGVLSSATAGQSIVNEGSVTWTSLPGTPGKISPYNDVSYERTGDPADPGGDANDYSTNDPATITVAGTIDKLQPTPAQYTIGDLVTYDIVVTLPEGTTNNLVVTDALPDGLQYQSSQLVTTSADSSGLLTADFDYTGTTLAATVAPAAPGDGTDISWNITTDSTNTVVVAADNLAANNSFLIRVTALVTNNPASHGDPDGTGTGTATTLTNHASMIYTTPLGTTSTVNDPTDPTVNVIEPQISTTKSVGDTDSDTTAAIAEPGETLTYTARFTNSGTSAAYEVTAEDKLPAGVQYNANSAAILTSSGVTSALDVTGTYNTAAQTINFTSSDGGWDINVGGWVEVQYTVTVMAAGFTSGSYVNTVDADWSSQNGTDPNNNEREYKDQVDGNNNPLYTVDGTQDQAEATFTVITAITNGSIGDTIWFDSNADAVQAGDATEPGISNVWVHLTADVDNNGTPELDRWIQTDANGTYKFDNLALFNNYVVTVDFDGTYAATHGGFNLEAAGYSQTFDRDGASSAHTTSNVSITASQPAVTDVDFGYTGSQTVGDLVWYDGDGDGVQPDIDTNEAGLGGIKVTLNADIDGDGIPEYTDTTYTTNDGSYHFDHLPAGTYTISITPPTGGVVTYDQDSGITTPDGSADFTLPATGGTRSDLDFGIRGASQLGDRIFFDVNNSGTQDSFDLGIANVKVNLSVDIDGDNNTDYTTSVITDDNGIYHFTGLLPGSYTVTVDQTTLPLGMHQTVDPDTSLDSTHLQVLGTTDIDTVDFGYTGNGAIGDRVWWDGNNNGFQDPGETGLAGVQLQLECDFDGDGTMEVIGTTTTDGNGNYLFDHLPAASGYIVTVVSGIPGTATPTYDLDGIGTPGETTTNLAYNTTTGQVDRTMLVDFGYKGSGSIGDTIWNDLDNGGDQDAGEPGIAGVKVTLSADLDGLAGNGNEFVVTTTTDTNGHYSFDGLFTNDSGIEYTVTVDTTTLPASVTPTYDYDGTGTANTATATLTTALPANNQVDFGYSISSSLGDRIWLDTDGDGVQDAGEHGLGGLTVTLYDSTGSQIGQQTTGSNGQYLFNNLAAGTYRVTVSDLPEGLQQTYDLDGLGSANTAAVTIGAAESNLTVDFGYRGTGSIGDRIWNDVDSGGDQDAGEPGIAGVTVTLVGDLNNDGDLTDPEDTLTTITDANGNYHFNGLFGGDYTVTVNNPPAGMVQTFDPDGTLNNSADVTLGGGNPMVTDTIDFGYHQSGTIGDRIWYDLNADGVQDAGELGLTGVSVSLYADANGDGIADGLALATTTTGADGLYAFDNLGAGSYLVGVTNLPGGMRQTYDLDGIGTANLAGVTIGAAESNLTVDFGYTGTGSIGDTIWNDLDNGGDQDAGEPGLAGVTVILTGDFNGDGIQDQLTTTTDADGHYSFDNLAANTYTITVDTTTLPVGMAQTSDPQGAVDNSAVVILGAGVTNDTIDFGYHQSATIGDTIWYDLNANGVQDAGELGLANIHVTLTGDYDGDGDIDTLHQYTDGSGHYSFTGLQVGSYTVTVDTASLPGGIVQTGDPDANLNNMSTVTLTTAANVNLDQDFGYTGTGAIGDTIWYDFDADGIQDAGEIGIPGITITLTGDLDNDGQIDDTITLQTDQNGHYQFDRLPEGQYTITVNPVGLPGGMVATGDPDGVLDNLTTVSLGAGQTTLIQDFGYTGTGSVGDTIWNDRNGNGVQDPGEPGIGGVTVTIGVDLNGDGTPDFTTSATTDAGGQYLFDHLPAGSHTLHVDPATLPPGIRPSYDPDGTLDGTFTIKLGAGENNRDVDFGYHFPTPKPPVTVTPVTPTVQPNPEPETGGFVADAFFMHRQFGEASRFGLEPWFPFDRWMEITYPQPPLPVSPIYTGIAEPGTTLALAIYDASGNLVGSQTIMADTAGNWLASFPGVLLHEMPHDMKVEQRISLYNESTAGLFNMRTYFNPNSTSLIKTSVTLDVDSIFDYLPSTIMDSVHSSLSSGFNIRWNNFNGYEFFATSINPAETGR